jgi:hypothetical protein
MPGPDRPYDSGVTMRDGLGSGGSGPGGDDAVPSWPSPSPREPGSGYPPPPGPGRWPAPSPGHRAHTAPGRGPGSSHRGRWLRPLLLAGLFAGILGLGVSVVGVVVQLMPRQFSAVQRQRIEGWEIGNRWRSWPAGQIFPRDISYTLPGTAFGGGTSLPLTAHRVGIAPQAKCRSAAPRSAAGVIAQYGCLAVLRATYEDTTQTLAVTIGVVVLPAASAAQKSAKALGGAGDPRAGVRTVAFRRTTTARFGDRSPKLSWDRTAGPYLVLATAGFADGRPWIARGDDTYTQAELLGLASGTAQRVASALGALPPAPHCPGSPAC